VDLFGTKARSQLLEKLEEARRECNDLREQHERLREALADREAALAQARKECEDLATRLAEADAQVARLRESLAQSERMVSWVSEKESQARTEADAARREVEALTKRLQAMEAEGTRLRSALEEANRAARRKTEPEPAPQPAVPPDDLNRLHDQIAGLRRALAEKEERLKLALRKAEHNRRAYLITQMQLDLAEDRIYLLTHGKPRPVLGERSAPPAATEQRVEAEEVEGAEDSDEAESAGDPDAGGTDATTQ